jgi:hypothetical protein
MISSIHPFRKFQIESGIRDAIRNLKQSSPNLFLRDQQDNSIGIFNIPINYPIERISNSTTMQKLMKNIVSLHNDLTRFSIFWDHYRQIFKFNNDLSKMLSLTDIEDIPWAEINLPYDNFYISFGNYGQEIFSTNSTIDNYQYIIDGAYVKYIDKGSLIFDSPSILITFTTALVNPKYEEAINYQPNGYHYSDPLYEYILSGKDVESLGDALLKGESVFIAYCEKMDQLNYDNSVRFCKNVNIPTNDEKLSLQKDRFLRSKSYITSSIPLLFNCIFYLTQYSDFVKEEYPKEAPTNLVEKQKTQKDEKIKSKIEREINNHGYSKVKFVSSVEKSDSISLPSNREINTHWRRGHWRNQAFGDNFTARKYIWIHPTIVRKDKGDPIGHVYDV